ncbi:MAG TPA: glycine cleavage system aminomethyltransferase GcvT [Kouleothrix sp.]|nr:glycine cleavage system aminomethyltransferase GcvT [Kouleothrix sp.]
MPERRTPLYDNHIRLGAQMVKGGGDYLFPLLYASAVEEHVNTRTNVGMQDLSTMGEVDVKGPGAERLLNHLLVNEIKDLLPGQARYSTMCREDGGVVDDITVYKFNDEHFMVVTSSGPRKKTARWIADHALGTSTYVTDISAAVALPVVQGPRSRDFLKAVAQEVDIDALKFFRFAPARIHDTELLISRSGYTGELGYELYTPAEEAGALWDYLLQQGREFGLKPYGVTAMQSLRLEKAFPLYGNDINEDYTPFHVGLDRWIRFDKRDFIGRDALLRVQQTGLDRRWVGLTLQGDLPAAVNATVWSVGAVNPNEEKIFSGPEAGMSKDRMLPGEDVGHVTFSDRGHTVGKILALAYVRTSHAYPGSRLLVDVRGKPVPAVVTPTPFFDPQGARLRAKA